MRSRIRRIVVLSALLAVLASLSGCASFPRWGSGGLLGRSALFRDEDSGLPRYYSDTSKDISRNLNR